MVSSIFIHKYLGLWYLIQSLGLFFEPIIINRIGRILTFRIRWQKPAIVIKFLNDYRAMSTNLLCLILRITICKNQLICFSNMLKVAGYGLRLLDTQGWCVFYHYSQHLYTFNFLKMYCIWFDIVFNHENLKENRLHETKVGLALCSVLTYQRIYRMKSSKTFWYFIKNYRRHSRINHSTR